MIEQNLNKGRNAFSPRDETVNLNQGRNFGMVGNMNIGRKSEVVGHRFNIKASIPN
jgi:hypothetical protein